MVMMKVFKSLQEMRDADVGVCRSWDRMRERAEAPEEHLHPRMVRRHGLQQAAADIRADRDAAVFTEAAVAAAFDSGLVALVKTRGDGRSRVGDEKCFMVSAESAEEAQTAYDLILELEERGLHTGNALTFTVNRDRGAFAFDVRSVKPGNHIAVVLNDGAWPSPAQMMADDANRRQSAYDTDGFDPRSLSFKREDFTRKVPGMLADVRSDSAIRAGFLAAHSDRPLVRDLLREYPGIVEGRVPDEVEKLSLPNLRDCRTKQELLEKTFSRRIPAAANKCTFAIGVACAAISPRMPETSKKILWQRAVETSRDPERATALAGKLNRWLDRYSQDPGRFTKPEWIEHVKASNIGYMVAYPRIADAIDPESADGRSRMLLHDLDRMNSQARKRMPAEIRSTRHLEQLHDEATEATTGERERAWRAEQAAREEARLAMKVDVTNSPYAIADEELAKAGFERLVTGKRMAEEAVMQHNCIKSYIGEMANEDSAFYSALVDGVRHSLQVTLDIVDARPHVVQLYGPCNQPASEKARTLVDDAIERTIAEAERRAECGHAPGANRTDTAIVRDAIAVRDAQVEIAETDAPEGEVGDAGAETAYDDYDEILF